MLCYSLLPRRKLEGNKGFFEHVEKRANDNETYTNDSQANGKKVNFVETFMDITRKKNFV